MKNFFFVILLFGISIIAVAQTPLAQINIEEPSLVCNLNECTYLNLGYTTPHATTEYIVNAVPYNPTFPFTGGTVIPPNGDDVWSPIFSLPFSFNFYGNCYNSVLVGTNGVITFDLTNNSPSGSCAWQFTQTIPNPTFPIRNAIYGVYQDTNIASPPVTNSALQNVNYYVLDTGVNQAPNRVFVVNFNALPQFQCNDSAGLQTSQIVIHETTNIIEVLVSRRTACTTWNSGAGLIGILNQAGTSALTPSGRNTGTWSATNEAWRFTPNGTEIPVTFSWFANEVLIANETSNTLLACPNENTTYRASMSFLNCNSETNLQSNTITQLLVADPGFGNPEDINVCTASPFIYTVDLTSNITTVLSGVANPIDYEIAFYDNLTDALNTTNNFINNTSSYSFTENQTIYLSITKVSTGCLYLKPFQLTIIPPVTPPTGNANQDFTAGQTLTDLAVTGSNLIWYDAPTAGNILPSTTLLQDNTTYYATQSMSGCESNRSINANRFAVTTTLVVLGNVSFNIGAFSVFPNPVDNLLTISGREILKSVSLYNTIGQEIMHLTPNQKELQINTATINSGVYFLKLNTEKESRTLKIIKN